MKKKEELSTFGVLIEEKDYHSMIISSLPLHLSNFASNLLAGAQLCASLKTIEPDSLIALVSEESECNAPQCTHHSGKSSKADEKDEAMAVWSTKDKCKPCGVCWGCGEKGHFKDKCPNPEKWTNTKKGASLKIKDISLSTKKGGSANATTESDSEDGGAFFTEDLFDDKMDPEMPGLQSVSDLEDEGESDNKDDWFSEVSNGEVNSDGDAEELSGVDGDEGALFIDVDLDLAIADLERIAAHAK